MFAGTSPWSLVSIPCSLAQLRLLGSPGFLIVPVQYALKLLGRQARISELGYHARPADDMIRRIGLPEAWSGWRR